MTEQLFFQMSGALGSGKTTIATAITPCVGAEVFRDWIANMKRPKHNYLLLDTTRSLEVCIEETIRYIKKGV